MDKKILLRVPAEIEKELKVLADADRRSLNNYIVLVLEKHVQETKGND
jgi:predicted HicB family RNase H-like nuclease